MFDPTISLGNILTIGMGVIVWVVTLVIAWTRFGGRLDLFNLRLKHVEDQMETLTKILEKFTNNEMRLALMQQELTVLSTDFVTLRATVEKLRVGEGFIAGPRRASVDGEYPAPRIPDGSR